MKLSREETGDLFEILGRLISAGISLGDSFALLAEDAHGEYKALCLSMAKNADNGIPLSDIIKVSGAFEGYAEKIIRVAEQTGRIETSLFELSRHYKTRHRMMKDFRASIISPLLILGVLIAVTVILVVWVLPVFNEVYGSLGSKMTGIAGALFSFGNGLRTALPWIFTAVAVLCVTSCVPSVKKRIKALFVSVFGDRGAYKKINSAAFISALSMAVTSGMTEDSSAELAADISANDSCTAFCLRCDRLVSRLKAGEALASSLRDCGFITATQARQLEIGRRSGRLDEAMADLAKETKLSGEEAIQKSLSLVEPAIVAVACLMIGGILMSVMLPLINIMNTIG